MKITELEEKMITEIVRSCYRGGPLKDNEPVWAFDIVDTAERKGFASSLITLIKKGLVTIYPWDEKDNVIQFTDAGHELATKMFPDA